MWKWIVSKWPLMRKATHWDRMASHSHRHSEEILRQAASLTDMRYAEIKRLREVHDQELERRSKVCDELIKRLSSVTWDRRGDDRYCISFEFSPNLTAFGGSYRDELDYIADRISRDIAHDIRTAKFVRKAQETNWERKQLIRSQSALLAKAKGESCEN
jgi:hypothetical protein